MQIEPANIDQIRQAKDGRMVLVGADAGGVAQELSRIHPCLKVRFAEAGNPPYWTVYYESGDGRETYLILTAKAHQGVTGAWEGLDHRVVDRIREVDQQGRSGYDYAHALETANLSAKADAHKRFQEKMGELGEQAAHAVRRDLGVRYKGRAFIPREVA